MRNRKCPVMDVAVVIVVADPGCLEVLPIELVGIGCENEMMIEIVKAAPQSWEWLEDQPDAAWHSRE